MSKRFITEIQAVQITKDGNAVTATELEKQVISEISLKLIINGQEFVSILCMNQNVRELAIGFLYNEGIISSREDIQDISFNEGMFAVIITLKENCQLMPLDDVRSITSGCGKGLTYINPLKTTLFEVLETNYQVAVSQILELMKAFNRKSEIFLTVGGVHSVQLVNNNVEILNEDIGRHNCLDKIAGILLETNQLNHAAESILLTSGRVSSEIMTKIIRLKIPIIVSRSAPTAAAITLAKKYSITILGYVRGPKANIYTCPERIELV